MSANYREATIEMTINTSAKLAAAVTRAASRQTYYTIRFLVDRDMVEDAYRAYGYFRWVDDWLDTGQRSRNERIDFIRRQQVLLEHCYNPDKPVPPELRPEEMILVDLVASDATPDSGLQAYIRNMMAVMAFDADRRGRLISQRELDDYTRWLAVAVTEALHHFIGNGCDSPQGSIRYRAVTGAHVTHLMRDAIEDVEAGYYNIPAEFLAASGSTPQTVSSRAYQQWVRGEVQKARACFFEGREHLSRVKNFRCRLAGYAYIYRFEAVLNCIEREAYALRRQYRERKSLRCMLSMLGWAGWMALLPVRHDAAPIVKVN
jgi:phytoene/squalene synthetase